MIISRDETSFVTKALVADANGHLAADQFAVRVKVDLDKLCAVKKVPLAGNSVLF